MFYNIVDACLEPQLAVKYDEFLIFRIAIFPDHGRAGPDSREMRKVILRIP